MKTSSKFVAAALAAMTLAASAGSALADRNQYTRGGNGARGGYGYHHHSRMYHHHRMMMRHHYRHMRHHRMM